VAADTIDHWITSKREALEKGLRRTDLFFLNDSEAELLTGESNMIVAGALIQEMGPRRVVIKKGEHGSLFFGSSGIAALPALPIEKVKDPTGAGDAFAGAMLGWLARTDSRDDDAMRGAYARATVMSSFVVEEFGVGRLASLSPSEFDGRLARLRELVRF
jgi:sugar/nucleoside kinase (ribokinase family)